MATKEKFPKSREDLSQQQMALLFGFGGNHSREEVMRDLQQLFDSCYEFGINPLPQIRKCFPDLEWQYLELREAQDKNRIIAENVDLFWRVLMGGVVTASRPTSRIDRYHLFGFLDGVFRQPPRNLFKVPGLH